MIKVFVNNKAVLVPKNTSALEACESIGVAVPRFCYHERLNVAGNCRMCLVEIEKAPKPIASCAFPVAPNMRIFTDTPLVQKARENVLEFLLLNHPLDCPICDQGGECDLQDQAMLFGSDRSRFYETKRGVEDKNCGPLIKTIMTRCIHCTRCVRFATEIAGLPDLGTTGRGKKTEIGTYVQKLIKSELSGNIIDLCPVGALTSKPYAFSARSWELKSVASIDIFDSLGSNTILNTKGDEVFRVLPRFNESLNEEWITDKVRFSYDGLKKQRLTTPFYINQIREFSACSWEKIFTLLKANAINNSNISIVAGDAIDIETLLATKSFLNSFGSDNFFSTQKNLEKADFSSSLAMSLNLENIEEIDLCVCFNINPKTEMPLLNTRLRKQVLSNKLKLVYFGNNMNLTFNAEHVGVSRADIFSFFQGQHPFCKKIFNYKRPLFIFGNEMVSFDLILIKTNLIELLKRPIKFCLLKKDLSETNLSYFGVKKLDIEKLSNTKILFLLNTSNFDIANYNISKDCLVIYVGTHGTSAEISFADLILPCTAFSEKKSSFFNVSGVVQATSKG